MSELSFSEDNDGNITLEKEPTLTIAYDACIQWAKVALEHRKMAIVKMEHRRTVWLSEEIDSGQKANSLEAEFREAMRAVVASVTCIDALYDHLLPFAPVPDATRAAWARNKTARYKQIVETIRATFAITPAETKALRQSFHAMFELRNMAIHPSNSLFEPYPHPELEIHTTWWLTAYRGDVADHFVRITVGLLWDLTRGKKYRTPELTKFISQFRNRVDQLLPNGRPEPCEQNVTFTTPKREGKITSSAKKGS